MFLNTLTLFRDHVFALDLQRLERLSAVGEELAEELQALQTQIVHEAAQNVQRKVQRVAHQERISPNQPVAVL